MATTYYYVIGGAGAGLQNGLSPENCWGSIADFFAINPTADQECLCYGGETLGGAATLASSGTSWLDAGRPRIFGCDAAWTKGAAQYALNANGQNYGINGNANTYWEV